MRPPDSLKTPVGWSDSSNRYSTPLLLSGKAPPRSPNGLVLKHGIASDRTQGGAEGGRSHAGDFAKRAREMALIGEASGVADLGKRGVAIEHAFASGADAQAMDVLADAFADAAAKDAGEMNGMDAGLAGEFVEREAAAVLGLQLVQDAGEPARGVAAFALRAARDVRHDFREQALDSKFVGHCGGLDFAEELHPEPQQRAAADVVARSVKSSRAIRKALLPDGTQLDFVKADAAGADFI